MYWKLSKIMSICLSYACKSFQNNNICSGGLRYNGIKKEDSLGGCKVFLYFCARIWKNGSVA